MDKRYANYNSIFGIYIHELAYIPIFKAFAHFLAELLTLTNLCSLCHLWPKWQRHISMHAHHRKFLLTTFIIIYHENMLSRSELQSFPRIHMCFCYLCHRHKWHKLVNVDNSARKYANALKIGVYANSWM